jgi:hypothetical protein
MTELPPIEKHAIESITFSLSFKPIKNVPLEELIERATWRDVIYIDAVKEDYEDDGLPMVEFCDEDGYPVGVIDPEDPLELPQDVTAYINDIDARQREGHEALKEGEYLGTDLEFTVEEDGWAWVTINSVIDRNIHRF